MPTLKLIQCLSYESVTNRQIYFRIYHFYLFGIYQYDKEICQFTKKFILIISLDNFLFIRYRLYLVHLTLGIYIYIGREGIINRTSETNER